MRDPTRACSPIRLLALALALVVAWTPLADACSRCNRDGSIDRMVEGTFIRFHPVTFTLYFEVPADVSAGEAAPPRVDRVGVAPMVVPQIDGRDVAWSAFSRGDRVRVTIHETPEGERIVMHVSAGDTAPMALPEEPLVLR